MSLIGRFHLLISQGSRNLTIIGSQWRMASTTSSSSASAKSRQESTPAPAEEEDPLQAIISEYNQGHLKSESTAKDAAGVFQEIENSSEKDNKLMLSKFVNHIMRQGKKSVAERLLRNSLMEIKKILPERDPVDVFVAGLNNVKPLVEVRTLRKSGKNYQVPVPVTTKRQFFLASKWIRTSALKKKGMNFGERLASEILDAFNGQGKSIDKRTELHKAAQANRAFSHFKF